MIYVPVIVLGLFIAWIVWSNFRNLKRQHLNLATVLCDSGSWKLNWGGYRPVHWFIDGKVDGHAISYEVIPKLSIWTRLYLKHPVQKNFSVCSDKELNSVEESLQPSVRQIFSDPEVHQLECRSHSTLTSWMFDEGYTSPPGLMLMKRTATPFDQHAVKQDVVKLVDLAKRCV